MSMLSLLVVMPLTMMSSDTAPYDVIEAESELIDGLTTELTGVWFSLVYAVESSLGLVALKLTAIGHTGLTATILMGICIIPMSY